MMRDPRKPSPGHGALLDAARQLYPRWAVRRFLSGCGLYLLIEARRPGGPGSES